MTAIQRGSLLVLCRCRRTPTQAAPVGCKVPVSQKIKPNTPENKEIGSIKYENGVLFLNKNKRAQGIPEAFWSNYIGGYKVMSKWFKSRKDETFDIEKMRHIENVVGALAETIGIQ